MAARDRTSKVVEIVPHLMGVLKSAIPDPPRERLDAQRRAGNNLADLDDTNSPPGSIPETVPERIERELGDLAEWIGDQAQELAADMVPDAGPGQDAAFLEFFYSLIHLTFGAFGSAMEAKRYASDAMTDVLQTIDGALFGPALAKRFGVTASDPGFQDWCDDHHRAAEQRGDTYASMPLFPRGDEGSAGTAIWEMCKQAQRSAGAEPGMSLMTTSLKIAMARSQQILPVADALLAFMETGDVAAAAKAASRPPDPRLALIADYGQRLVKQARRLVRAFGDETSQPAARWETSYLLLYLTLRPAREQWGLILGGKTTSTVEMIEYWVLREVVCVESDFDPEYGRQTEEERAKVNDLTTQQTFVYFERQQMYDQAPYPGTTRRGTVPWVFLQNLEKRIGKTFDENQLVGLSLLCIARVRDLDPVTFMNAVASLA